jgi:hypothetical protein
MDDRTPIDKARDRLAWALANAALKIGTPWYRAMIGGSIRYGLEASVRDGKKED